MPNTTNSSWGGAAVSYDNTSSGLTSTNVQDAIDEVSNNTDSIRNHLFMQDRTFLFVGDSYAAQSNSWVTHCVSAAGVSHYTNLAISGTAFYDGTFLSQISEYTGDKTTITDIVVGGGLNDSLFSTVDTNYTTLTTAMSTFVTYARTNYPNAKIWLAFMGNALDDAPLLAGRTWNKRIWAKWTYENYGRTIGFTIINDSDYALACNVALYASDRIHPNANGAKAIGLNIANALCGGDPIYRYPLYNVGLTAIGNNIIESGGIQYAFNNGVFDFNCVAPLLIKIGTDYPTVSGMNGINLVTMDNTYFNKKYVIKVEGRLDGYDSKSFQTVPLELEFYQNKIVAQIDTINSAGSAYQSYTASSGANAKLSMTRGFNFTVPAYYIN